MKDRQGWRKFSNRKEHRGKLVFSGKIANGKEKYMRRERQLNRGRKLLSKQEHVECGENSRLVCREFFSVYMFGKVKYIGKIRKDSLFGRDTYKVGSFIIRQIVLRQLDQVLCSFACQCLRQLRFLSIQWHLLRQFWYSQMQYARPQQRLFFRVMCFYICQCFRRLRFLLFQRYLLRLPRCFQMRNVRPQLCPNFLVLCFYLYQCLRQLWFRLLQQHLLRHLWCFPMRYVRPHLRQNFLVLCSYTYHCLRSRRFLLSQRHLLRRLRFLRRRYVRLHLCQNFLGSCSYTCQRARLQRFLLFQQHLYRQRWRSQLCLHFLEFGKRILFMYARTCAMGHFIMLKFYWRLQRQTLCYVYSYLLRSLTISSSIIFTSIYSSSFFLSFSFFLCLSCHSCLSVLFFFLLIVSPVMVMMLRIILSFGIFFSSFVHFSSSLLLNFTDTCITLEITYKYSPVNIYSFAVFFISLFLTPSPSSLSSSRNPLSSWTFISFSPSCSLVPLDAIYALIPCISTQLSSYCLKRTHRIERLLPQFSYCDPQYQILYDIYCFIRHLSYYLRSYLLCFEIGLHIRCICDINYLHEFCVCKYAHFKCNSIILLLRGVYWKLNQWYRANKEVEWICMRNVDLMWDYPIGSGEERVDYSMKLNNSVRQNDSRIERRKKSKASIAEKIDREMEKRKKEYNIWKEENNKSKRRRGLSKNNRGKRISVIRREKQRAVGNKGVIAWKHVGGKKGKRSLNKNIAERMYVGIDLFRERSKTVKLSERNKVIRIRYRIDIIKGLFGKYRISEDNILRRIKKGNLIVKIRWDREKGEEVKDYLKWKNRSYKGNKIEIEKCNRKFDKYIKRVNIVKIKAKSHTCNDSGGRKKCSSKMCDMKKKQNDWKYKCCEYIKIKDGKVKSRIKRRIMNSLNLSGVAIGLGGTTIVTIITKVTYKGIRDGDSFGLILQDNLEGMNKAVNGIIKRLKLNSEGAYRAAGNVVQMFANRGIGGCQITKAMETARCKERITVNRGTINDCLMTNVIQTVGCKDRIIVKGGKTLYPNFVEDFKFRKYWSEKLEKFSALLSKPLLLILEHIFFNQTSLLTNIEEVDKEALVIRIVIENKIRSEICSVEMISPRNNGTINCYDIIEWMGDRVVLELKRMRLVERKMTAEAQVKAWKVAMIRMEGNEVRHESSERMDRNRGVIDDTLIDKGKNKWDKGFMNIIDKVIVIKEGGVSDSRILNLNRGLTEDILINYEKDKMEIWFVRMIGNQAAIIDVGCSEKGHQINWINLSPQKLLISNINSQKCRNKDVKVFCLYTSNLNSNKLRKTRSIKKGNLLWVLEKYFSMRNVISCECTSQKQQGNREGIMACMLIKKVEEYEHLLRINLVEVGRTKKKTQLEGKRRVYINVIHDEFKKGKMQYMNRNLKYNWTRRMENKKDD